MTNTAPQMRDGLEALVPASLFKYCSIEGQPRPGATQSAMCRFPSTLNEFWPDRVELSTYPDTTALQAAFTTLKKGNARSAVLVEGKGRCTGIQWGGDISWLHGPGEVGGRVFCFFDTNQDAVIIWTHESKAMAGHSDLIGIARVSGSDHPALFNWWRYWHHRIGEPTGSHMR